MGHKPDETSQNNPLSRYRRFLNIKIYYGEVILLMKKRLISIMIILVLMITLFTPMSYAVSGTKKTTVYKIIKSGNSVYCSMGGRIYRVNLKTENVKILTKNATEPVMKLKGKYLYYSNRSYGIDGCNLYRIYLKTNKQKKLAKNIEWLGFAIRGKRIYYSALSSNSMNATPKYRKKSMRLNGKNKSKSKYKGKAVVKKSNVSGYKTWHSYYQTSDLPCYVDYYLETPKKSILLEHKWTVPGC